MSSYEKIELIKQDTKSMKFLYVAILTLFSLVLFCSYIVPMVKDNYNSVYVAALQ